MYTSMGRGDGSVVKRALSALLEGLSLISRWLTPSIIQVLGDWKPFLDSSVYSRTHSWTHAHTRAHRIQRHTRYSTYTINKCNWKKILKGKNCTEIQKKAFVRYIHTQYFRGYIKLEKIPFHNIIYLFIQYMISLCSLAMSIMLVSNSQDPPTCASWVPLPLGFIFFL